MPGFSYNCYKEDFSSIEEVIVHFKAIEEELSDTLLVNLIHFTRTYRYITEAVYESLNSGSFQNRNRMIQFDVAFAKYYFKALKEYAEGRKIPAAWQKCFDYCTASNTKNTLAMALGINAHVNNDLSQTLADYHYTDEYKSDFSKVNKIIASQLSHIIEEAKETRVPFIWLQQIPSIYFIILTLTIKFWRSAAWTNHFLLINNKKTKSRIEQEANTLAKTLLLLA